MTEISSPSRLPWLYEGIWGLLTNVFCVPREAPQLPTVQSESIVSRKPSPAFITYLLFQFSLVVAILLLATLVASVAIVIAAETAWVLLGTALVLFLLGVFVLVGYLAIYLRYDTTWYVFSDRSMRLRRGIWVIRESTITFENVQNVKVTQGPLQRFFGIANVVVETAGGGGGAAAEGGGGLSMHAGLIEGVAEAAQIRDSIMSHVRNNATAGLGDEHRDSAAVSMAWSPQHLAVLREIRDLAQQAAIGG
jgi:membrane protein YdbS with pleckstrin-like domain